MTSTRLGFVLAVLAGLQVIAGASNLTELMPTVVANWFILLVAALQVGFAVYTGRQAELPADFVSRSRR